MKQVRIPTPGAPSSVTKSVLQLSEELVPSGTPMYLNVEPADWAEVNECFSNVSKMVAREGGGMQYGWLIWEALPDVMIEAEFHAVWVDRKGVYHDITPKALPGLNRVLFLADFKREYQGKQINNVRKALVEDPAVTGFIQAADQYFEATNRGDMADYHGEITLTPELMAIRRERAKHFVAVVEKYYG
jgi:hypothetical protein